MPARSMTLDTIDFTFTLALFADGHADLTSFHKRLTRRLRQLPQLLFLSPFHERTSSPPTNCIGILGKYIRETKDIRDSLRRPIDPKILQSAATLRGLGFVTSGSCEGHLKRGPGAPWIDIGQEPSYQELAAIGKSGIATELQQRLLTQNLPPLRGPMPSQ